MTDRWFILAAIIVVMGAVTFITVLGVIVWMVTTRRRSFREFEERRRVDEQRAAEDRAKGRFKL